MNTLLTYLFITMSSITLASCDKPSTKEKEKAKMTEHQEVTQPTTSMIETRENPVEFEKIKGTYKDGRDALDALIMNEEMLLLDFYAPWCGPCRGMHPVLEKLVKNHPEIRVVKINTEKEPAIARQYGIRSIPQFIYFKKGKKQKNNLVGAQQLEQLETYLK